jgi:hypothetical protein
VLPLTAAMVLACSGVATLIVIRRLTAG